jgi:hypothetical protein
MNHKNISKASLITPEFLVSQLKIMKKKTEKCATILSEALLINSDLEPGEEDKKINKFIEEYENYASQAIRLADCNLIIDNDEMLSEFDKSLKRIFETIRVLQRAFSCLRCANESGLEKLIQIMFEAQKKNRLEASKECLDAIIRSLNSMVKIAKEEKIIFHQPIGAS